MTTKSSSESNTTMGKTVRRKKKRGTLEFLFENGVRLVAFLSVTAIIAIFFFVCRESFYAFREYTPAVTEYLFNDSVRTDHLQPQVYPPPEPADEMPVQVYPPPDSSVGSTVSDSVQIGPAGELFRQDQGGEALSHSEPLRASDLFAVNDTVNGEANYIWQPTSRDPKFSLMPLLSGSLKVSVVAMAFAAPIALLAALFTVVYAPRRIQQILKPTIEIMAGFPTVVIGFFTLMILAGVIQEWFDTDYRLNAFVAGLGLSLAVIPIIYTIIEDSLVAVPKDIREGGLALGATKWQTAWRVLFPAALPGVLAGLMLGFGRAFGETMIVLMASGNAPIVSGDFFQSVRTMTATIGSEMAETEFRGVHYGVLFFTGAVLFFITFSINALVEIVVRRFVAVRRGRR